MPKKKLEWTKIRVFTKATDLETFLRIDSHRNISKSGAQTLLCNECENVISHNMLLIYRYCSSVKCHTVPGDKCPFRYRIHKCASTEAYHVYETTARHLDRDVDLEDKQYGIHSLVKEEIDNFFSQRIRKAMDICITLTTNQVKNGQYQGISIPNTYQISRQLAKIKNPEDDNEYDRVINQINNLVFKPDQFYEPNQAFIFGPKLGDGSDRSHFIFNFTSFRLLETISINNLSVTDKNVFHVDSTYKITKQRYPLVVIGRSDQNGTFFPICVSIVIHEQTQDFSHIFQSLKDLCLTLNISLNPTCFVQDACMASKNAIKTIFGSIHIIMCWFLVFQNV